MASMQDTILETALETTEEQVARARRLLIDERAVDRLNAHDATLWSMHPETVRQIADSLGWLDVMGPMAKVWPELVRFRDDARLDGFTHAVLLGMGGSSLISILWTRVFGRSDTGLVLSVLDSTDPDVITELEATLPLGETLFLVASKSGTTTEPNAFHRYFWRRLEERGHDPRPSFVAITDPGTTLADEATQEHWRHVFLNPPDIGGRYSALSLFGLVPAALMGIDGEELLQRAAAMREALHAPADSNPGLELGAILGGAVQSGRDKVTLLCTPRLQAFATWLEQLLAESTGKAGTGVVPVAEPDLAAPAVYGADRLLVRLRLADDLPDAAWDAYAGHPRIAFTLPDTAQLGAEFLRWEAATALAGRVLGINPFDQPNVQESKDNTRDMLQAFQQHGRLPEVESVPSLYATSPALGPLLSGWLAGTEPGQYLAIMAYVPYDAEMDEKLSRLQVLLRDRLKMPVTVGYGPRFLHSTGQMHKGGPATGRYLQLTAAAERVAGLDVPGSGYTFNILIQAQSLGDLKALAGRGRPVMTVNLGGDPKAGLARLLDALKEVLPQ